MNMSNLSTALFSQIDSEGIIKGQFRNMQQKNLVR